MRKPNITGIHHIAIKCSSIEQYQDALDFYGNVLGLKFARKWGEGASEVTMLDTGAGIMEIFASAQDEPSVGAVRHFAFQVEDTDACADAVRAAGYKITVEPKDVELKSDPIYPARIAFCIGPVGEEVEFFQLR